MPSHTFLKGFRHELANRAFAYLAVRRMADRLQSEPAQSFWSAYADLEAFNQPRYHAAACRWGVDPRPGPLTRLKARLVSSVPRPLQRLLLRLVHHETTKYLAWLRRLRQQGPADAGRFLDYMIDQEQLQLDMMRMALAGRYRDVVRHADDFFLKYDGVRLLAEPPTPQTATEQP
ncbi:hypothetical protein N5D48_09795 [Pseudomonas sp. GD03858]|uniref:hypothetical protein n=1 Tax=unclassified Pseudomonas TaxID=196821 RepID=UPI0024492C05|nr:MULTISPECIES: hypothetical protein [unclassified Pseudomonas]MDH0646964.1 hypothetical protein [Pseudomonas sp. GD03867]MDH0662693.1 hypothetical protein [Pseudomonas sp. GD03858]